MKLRLLVAALVLPLLALPATVSLAGPSVAADSLSVTWPDVTSFNPSAYDYVLTVDDEASRELFAWFTVSGTPSGCRSRAAGRRR